MGLYEMIFGIKKKKRKRGRPKIKIKRPNPPRPRKKFVNTWWKDQKRYSDGTFGGKKK